MKAKSAAITTNLSGRQKISMVALGIIASLLFTVSALGLPSPQPAPEPAPQPVIHPDQAKLHADSNDLVYLWSDASVDKPIEGSSVTILGNVVVKQPVNQSVVVIGGTANVLAEVADSVVALIGDVTTSKKIGNSVVAVMGDVTVDNEVGDSTIAVLGNVNLGPHAIVHGSAVSVGGMVSHDDAAVVDHNIQSIGGVIATHTNIIQGIRAWFKHAFLLGRPLAIGEHLGWVWVVALGVLAFYMLIALAMPQSLNHCSETLRRRPWSALLTAILSIVGVPLTGLVMLVTVIGIPLVPIYLLAIFFASIFGRIVVIATLGTWILSAFKQKDHRAIWKVLVGGLLVMAVYLIPIIGDVSMHLIGFMGFGAVLLTVLTNIFARKPKSNHPPTTTTDFRHAEADLNPSQSTTELESAMVSSEAADPLSPLDQNVEHQSAELTSQLEHPATFKQRMFALAIDVVFIQVLVTGLTSFDVVARHLDDDAGFPNLIPLAVYAAVLWTYRSTTAGGSILKLRVERVDGLPMDARTSIIRALSCFLSLFAAGLGFLWILRDEKQEAWHDKISGTRVVQSNRPLPLV